MRSGARYAKGDRSGRYAARTLALGGAATAGRWGVGLARARARLARRRAQTRRWTTGSRAVAAGCRAKEVASPLSQRRWNGTYQGCGSGRS